MAWPEDRICVKSKSCKHMINELEIMNILLMLNHSLSKENPKNQVTEGDDKAFVLIIDLIVFSVSPSLCVLVPLIGETFERSHICMFLEYHEFSCIISPLSWWHVAYKDLKDILLKGSSPSL